MANSRQIQDLIRLGPNDNTYYFKIAETNAPSLAGLLDFQNTKDLGKWLESPNVQELWNAYHDFRIRGFGSIGTKATPIGLRDCMQLWAKREMREFLREENVRWQTIPVQTRPLLVTLWYACRIVTKNPEVFSKFVGFPEGAENIARAIRCLRLMWDRKVKSLPVAPQKNQCALGATHYPDPANLEHQQRNDSRYIAEPVRLPASTDGPSIIDWRKTNDPLTDIYLKEIEQQMTISKDDLLGTIRSQTIGIDPAFRTAFMKAIAKKVTVLQRGGSHPPSANQRLVELAGNAAGIAYQNPVHPVTDDASTPSSEEAELFWQLQNAIGSLSCANTSTYDEAKVLFTSNGDGDPTIGGLTLKPWQVIGVKWMLDQEMSPVRGGIVADGCGLGKTIQTLAFLAVVIQREEASTLSSTFQPTLVITPPPVIQTWIDEYTDHFAETFTLRPLFTTFHSGRSQAQWVRDATLSPVDAKHLWDEGGIGDHRNPQTRRLILVTTYETLARRFQLDASNDTDQAGTRNMWVGRFFRVVCDEGHRIKDQKTDAWAAVSGLQTRYRWILTATPLANRILDYSGYLALFFRPQWAQEAEHEEDPSQPYKHFLSLDEANQTIENGLHLLDPDLFSRNVALGDMAVERVIYVLPALARIIQLQRTAATMVDMGGGQVQRIGDSIPPFSVSTIELAMCPQAQTEYNRYHKELYAQLKQWNPANQEDENEPTIVFNNRFYRRLAHIAFSPLLERFALRISHNGVKEIEDFRKHTDGGARLFVQYTMLDWGMPVPQAASDLVEFLTSACPKLGYLCGLLADVVLTQGNKLIIFAEWPLVMWMTEMLLGLLDIPYVAIRASTRGDEKNHIMRQFNDNRHPALVLLTTFRTCSLGINLQRACHHMVVLEPARNINTLLQAIGRINRIGQANWQFVTILFSEDTFNRWQEYMSTKKFMAQLSGSLFVHGRAGKQSERTVMELLGQPQPRLPMWNLQLPLREVRTSSVEEEGAEKAEGEEEYINGEADEEMSEEGSGEEEEWMSKGGSDEEGGKMSIDEGEEGSSRISQETESTNAMDES